MQFLRSYAWHFSRNAVILTYNQDMKKMWARQKGFTLVELLIVIVVIAIIALIATVAYSGVLERSRNTKTVDAVTKWVRLLEMYKIDNGTFPTSPVSTCLGTSTTYPGNVCDGTIGVDSGFLTAMQPYTNNKEPEPDATNVNIPATVKSGAVYNSGSLEIYYTISGSYSVLGCPSIAGKTGIAANTSLPSGFRCKVKL